MTTVLQVKNLQKKFGEREIIKGISFEIRQGEKIGLVGWNGSGKTTLVNMLMGRVAYDRGSITTWPLNLKMGYLPQSTDYTLNVEDELTHSAEELFQTSKRLGLHKQIIENEEFQHLSGGERLKLSIAKIWANHPEFLILDEPTNHLDLQGINWLKEEVSRYDGAALIISHDRRFLDQTVNKIFEIEDGKLNIYDGNYSAYRSEKKRRYEQQKREYEKQQRKVAMIEEQVSVIKNFAEKAHKQAGKGGTLSENRQMGLKQFERAKAKKKDKQVKSKLNRLNLELSKKGVEKPKEEADVFFHFDSAGKRGKRLIEIRGLTKQYGENLLFEKSHFYIKHGERIALIGSNGAGKTTFIKMLLEEEPVTKGSIWKSESMKIAYLSQDVSDLPEDMNVYEYLELEERDRVRRAETIFANMGLDHAKLSKPISHFSLGERTRVKLVGMILQDYDVLILDEPTNHLDLPSREQLEDTLNEFNGTLMIVSHDRFFVEKLCDKLLVIENKQIHRYEMGLKEYEDKKAETTGQSDRNIADELVLVENKITELLGKISFCKTGTDEYLEVDQELQAFMKRKRKLMEEL
ncbi:ribosomal protection-like ABC-F family protein [Fictibacillus phosphorivorans]|uniref:ribosomal protection-like ABC-F family protein n=1 Tax=Fictibacillus phosphorivorans TaxID=1221500 RepID=UPI00203A451D|nr:ABC-F type ribosomal protection protein [Fictibacillus phosphorivorans]MCM3718967.1 ABC-F type ribosomal protection protein [Fictibacillus phosphorivorans]MCM3776589.1 ABC-F type ribosomal protection protein [Fictibacillus phosphorivorans]